jgi:small-conductance mechanosensitive channel
MYILALKSEQMEPEKSIALRPKFEVESKHSVDKILEKAKQLKTELKADYQIKIIDEHLYFYFSKEKRKYYSPFLHLELEANEDKTTVKGLFGPEQLLWTLFMFLHFIIAGLFLVFAMMAYTHWSLNQSIVLDVVVMSFMLIFWVLLYFIARINREKGVPQMHELEDLMYKVLE